VLAHEIRNPLAALKGHAQLLAERAGEGPFKLRADRVVNEAIRLETLTNGLLQFAASGTIHVGPAIPEALLGRAIAATDPGRIEAHTSSAPAVWHLDESRIEQVLVNLLDNALAVTPPHAKVTATISIEEDCLVYTIRDHGPGLSPEERTRIFDAFYTTKIHGTGLGLSVSKRIIDLHHGSIVIEDATGGGALFRVALPRPGGRAGS
jgi:two-component system sensor histidine kinase HydH